MNRVDISLGEMSYEEALRTVAAMDALVVRIGDREMLFYAESDALAMPIPRSVPVTNPPAG